MPLKAWPKLKKLLPKPSTGLEPVLGRGKKTNEIITRLQELEYINVTLDDNGTDVVKEMVVLANPFLPVTSDDFDLSNIAAGGGANFPFDITLTDAGANWDATLRPGNVSGIMPSNMNSTFTITKATTYWIVVSCTATGNAVSSCSISFDTSAPAANSLAANAPPSTFKILIGYVLADVAYNMIVSSPSAAASSQYQVHKTPPIAPGESPWDYYYGWSW